jgi:hypothetical protein
MTPLVRTAFVCALLVLGCAERPPGPATLDESIRQAMAQSDLLPAVQVVRQSCLGRTCVVIARAGEPTRDVGLYVFESDAPFLWQAASQSGIDAEPGTALFMDTDDTVYVYGVIRDPRITTLSISLVDGGQIDSEVRAPGYVMSYPSNKGFPQAWSFRDAAGRQISGSTP